MNQSGDRYKFEFATDADSKKLLEIMEEESSPGKISLIYTRRPNSYQSFLLEGENTKIAICRDTYNKEIAGYGALSFHSLYINGKETKVGYFFAIRVRDAYKGKLRIYKGYELLGKGLPENQYCYTTILDENLKVQRMLEKKRPGIPAYIPFGTCNFYVLKTGKKTKLPNNYVFKRCEESVLDLMINFLNEQGKKMQLFPVLTKEYLMNNPTISYNDFYLLFKNDELIACGALWDQQNYKQLIIKTYKGIYKFLYQFKILMTLFGYPKLEKPGNKVNYFTLAFWAAKDNNESDLKILISNIAYIAKSYSYFIVGVHEKSNYNKLLKRLSKVVYKSKLYTVNRNHKKKIEMDKTLIPYIETGLL